MISTKNLSSIGDIDDLKRLLQSLAVLDLIMCTEKSHRSYSFNNLLGENEQVGVMQRENGDSFHAWFTKNGCFFRGNKHDSKMSSCLNTPKKPWQGIYTGVPDTFKRALSEPSFSIDDVSFCFWRQYSDEGWKIGEVEFAEGVDPDGSIVLLDILNGNPGDYQDFVEEFYEEDIPLLPIRHIYAHKLITDSVLEYLNPKVSLCAIENDLKEIGYPTD